MVASKDKSDVTKQLYHRLDALTNINRYVVALSGGVDSVALTHMLGRLPTQYIKPVVAIHVNHGLHPEADNWQTHCAAFCQDLGVSFIAESVQVANMGKGIEAAARDLRYAALSKHLNSDDALFTAHHQQDQAETVLLNLFRGAGVDGLAGMPIVKELEQSVHVRPLLNISKTEIESYAAHHQLTWVTDPSNKDTAYTRNYIRESLLPNLRQRWSEADKVLSRTAQNMGQAGELLEDLAVLDLANTTDNQHGLKLDTFSELSLARQHNLLRYWLGKQQLIPSTAQLDTVLNQCIGAAEDATPAVKLEEYVIRRYRDRLYLLLQEDSSPLQPCVPLSNHVHGI